MASAAYSLMTRSSSAVRCDRGVSAIAEPSGARSWSSSGVYACPIARPHPVQAAFQQAGAILSAAVRTGCVPVTAAARCRIDVSGIRLMSARVSSRVERVPRRMPPQRRDAPSTDAAADPEDLVAARDG